MKTLIILFVAILPVIRQESVSELDPRHATAVERYLSDNKNLTFRQEINLSGEYLKSVHQWMGKNFKPNYAVGDFNRDRIKDFAVLLYRDGKPTRNVRITSEEHSMDYPLRLVVFNGTRKGFRVAFTKDIDGPPAAYIRIVGKLYYGVFESDADTFVLTPVGKGYVLEFQKEP